MSGFSKTDRTRLRATLVALILVTDLKLHFETLAAFQQQFGTAGCSSAGEEDLAADLVLETSTPAARMHLMQMTLKCADLGHLARPLPIHLRWVKRLQQECWQQGDEEIRHRLPVMPMNDRANTLSPKSQVGFFEVSGIRGGGGRSMAG